MVTSDATRSKIITEQINRMKQIGEDTEKLEKSRDFWQADLENCRLVSYNLEHELLIIHMNWNFPMPC